MQRWSQRRQSKGIVLWGTRNALGGEIRKVSPTQNGGIRQRDQARQSRPFRRNDEMLSVMPAGLIVFLGNGITGNLADKARRLGIPVWQASGDGA